MERHSFCCALMLMTSACTSIKTPANELHSGNPESSQTGAGRMESASVPRADADAIRVLAGDDDSAKAAIFEGLLGQYADALIVGDEERVRALLSTERLNRIAQAESQGHRNAMQMFMQKERSKLIRSLGEGKRFLQAFKASKMETADRSRMAATFSFEGTTIPRPIYFVQEAGGVRINLTPPRKAAPKNHEKPGAEALWWDSSSDYVIKSVTNKATSADCIETPAKTVPANSTITLRCYDFACSLFMDGAKIGDGAKRHFCDYNTYGVDFYMYGIGWGACTEDC